MNKNLKIAAWAGLALIIIAVAISQFQLSKQRERYSNLPAFSLDNLAQTSGALTKTLVAAFPSKKDCIRAGREAVKTSSQIAANYQLVMRTKGYDVSLDDALYAVGLIHLELRLLVDEFDKRGGFAEKPTLEFAVNNFMETGHSPVSSAIRMGLEALAPADKSPGDKLDFEAYLLAEANVYNQLLAERAEPTFVFATRKMRDERKSKK